MKTRLNRRNYRQLGVTVCTVYGQSRPMEGCMRRLGLLLVAVALVATLAAVPLAGATVFATDDTTPAETDENDSVTPGEQMMGAVGVQNAELAGTVSERAFGLQVANAETDEERANIISERFVELRGAVAEHEAELEELRDARERGEITEGQFRAGVAKLTAKGVHTERGVAQANASAGGMPTELLAERGINVSAIQELKANASQLTGPETAEIARSIAGNVGGNPFDGDREPGPPEWAGSGTETERNDTDDRQPGPPEWAGSGNAGDDSPGNNSNARGR